MAYPQDPNNPYGQPDQNPYGQTPQNPAPFGEPAPNPYGQPQPGGLFDSGGQQPYGQPANPFDSSGGQPTQPYGQPGGPYDSSGGQLPPQPYGQPYQNPYGQPGNPYDASGGQIPTQAYGQQPQYGMPGFPQQGYYGAPPVAPKSNNGMVIGIIAVVVVVALGVGGYFLTTGKNKNSPVASSVQTSQITGAPTASGGPTASGSPAAPPTGSAPNGFTPPTSYSSNSLEEDDGCGSFAGAEADFLSASDDITDTTSADTAFNSLASETKKAAGDAENSTLASALTAESAFITQNESSLAAGMVAYNNSSDDDSSQFSAAFQGIASTDTYVNGVCGLDSWSPTEP